MIDDVIIKWLKEFYDAMKASSGGTVQDWTDKLDAAISGINAGGKLTAVKLTSGSTWSHPADLNTQKYVEAILVPGGGGGGKNTAANAGGGGGGGGEIIYRAPVFLTGSSTAYLFNRYRWRWRSVCRRWR